MSYPHVVVWIDHHRASVIEFSPDGQQVTHLASENPQPVHRKSGTRGTGRVPDDRHLFDDVAAVAGRAREILVVGPGTAKRAFVTDLGKHHRLVADKVLGVEPLDHPTDGELVAFARQWFRAADALRGSV